MKLYSSLTILLLATVPAHAQTPSQTPEDTDLSSQSIVQLAQRLRVWREARSKHEPAFAVRNQKTSSRSQRFLQSTLQGKAGEDAPQIEAFGASWRWSNNYRTFADPLITTNQRAAEAWNLGVDAPIVHPWGTAKLVANYEETGGGVATTPEAAMQENERNGGVALVQDLKIGTLSGSTKIALSQNNTNAAFTSTPESQNGTTEGSANLRWQLLPSLAVTGSHQSRLEKQRQWSFEDEANRSDTTRHNSTVGLEWKWQRKLSPNLAFNTSHRTKFNWQSWQTNTSSELGSLQAEQQMQNLSDLGLQWKWTKATSISLGASQTRVDRETLREDVMLPTSLRNELKATLALQHRTSAGSWKLNLARLRADEDVANSEDRENNQVTLEAERKLLSWLSLRGAVRLTGDDNYLNSLLNEQAQREAEAQFHLSSFGRFAVRYADWERRQSTLSGDNASDSGAREYGVRYNLGDDKGLGLSVEYNVRAERAGDNTNNWRVGVTYR
jgi:hypothetical protein